MYASARLLQRQLGMIPALPVQNQANSIAVGAGDDFLQDSAQDALLELWRTLGVIPQAPHIMTQCQEFVSRGIAERIALLAP
jgi:hypothetical protein